MNNKKKNGIIKFNKDESNLIKEILQKYYGRGAIKILGKLC